MELGTVDQVVEDWQTQPFVDIIVVSEEDCPPGTEAVFSRPWAGTIQGCDARASEKAPRFQVQTYDGYRQRHHARYKTGGAKCPIPIQPIPPVNQTRFYGKSICGVRGGQPFETVNRAERDTELCPKGLYPCTEATSPENTICYPNEYL